MKPIASDSLSRRRTQERSRRGCRLVLGVVALVGVLWTAPAALAGDGARLVKDIDPGSKSSSPDDLAKVGKTLFFDARDGRHGIELWRSDGAKSGTRMVKDINPGRDHSAPVFGPNEEELTDVGKTLFFPANDGRHGQELWRTDGTKQGTKLVKDINPHGPSHPRDLTAVGRTLFFTADDGDQGLELWRSDGTKAGTELVKDINPDGDAFSRVESNDLTNVGGTLFFVADDGSHGFELWRSDGTGPGTKLVKDVNPGSGSGHDPDDFQHSPPDLTNVGGTLYFDANDGSHGYELWRSEGTPAGTGIVKDIDPGSGGSGPQNLSNVGGTLFFVADDGTHGSELWRSDGTSETTEVVKDVDAVNFPKFVDFRGRFFFFVNSRQRHELWRSDGTPGGTELVANINPGRHGPGGCTPFFTAAEHLTRVDGTLFFAFSDPCLGQELWRSDGTAAGTRMVKNIDPGGGGLGPRDLTSVGGTLFFTAVARADGEELWKATP